MNKTEAIEIIWNYMHMEHELIPADLICILGSLDPRYRCEQHSPRKR